MRTATENRFGARVTHILSRVLFSALLLIALAAPRAAAAATFCVVGEAIPPQCLYDDVDSCNAAAVGASTHCDINPDVRLMAYGSQPYCIVGSDRQEQCLYIDRAHCNADAGKAHAICIERAPDRADVSPFRYDNRIQR